MHSESTSTLLWYLVNVPHMHLPVYKHLSDMCSHIQHCQIWLDPSNEWYVLENKCIELLPRIFGEKHPDSAGSCTQFSGINVFSTAMFYLILTKKLHFLWLIVQAHSPWACYAESTSTVPLYTVDAQDPHPPGYQKLSDMYRQIWDCQIWLDSSNEWWELGNKCKQIIQWIFCEKYLDSVGSL